MDLKKGHYIPKKVFKSAESYALEPFEGG